jgi:hypothetical protein
MTPDGKCVHFWDVVHGATHDKARLDHSGLASKLCCVGKHDRCLLPHKRPPGGEFTNVGEGGESVDLPRPGHCKKTSWLGGELCLPLFLVSAGVIINSSPMLSQSPSRRQISTSNVILSVGYQLLFKSWGLSGVAGFCPLTLFRQK